MLSFITPKTAKIQVPLVATDAIDSWRKQIASILFGNDARIFLIVGPCSIHNIHSAHDYAEKLKGLADQVQDVFVIAMRTYFEKARTQAGWKGLLYDPFIDGTDNMHEGIRLSRSLLKALTEMGLPCATEFLEPLASAYLEDCISWGSIGARTCQSPIHRQLASSLSMPIGFKNRNDGDTDVAIKAILSARHKHHFLGINSEGYVCQIEGPGNPYTHLVLRGSDHSVNYDQDSIANACQALAQANLPQSIVVDCAHGNSKKRYQNQVPIFSSLIDLIASGENRVRGIMLESFLAAGSQGSLFGHDKSLSITDPCIDWQTTKELVLSAAEILRQKVPSCV